MLQDQVAATAPEVLASESSTPAAFTAAPWQRDDILPPAPSVSPYGICYAKRTQGYADLATLQREIDEKAELVWTPAHKRCALAAEIPELRPRLYALELKRVATRFRDARFYAVFYALVIAAHYAMKLQTVPRHLLFLMSFGVLPFMENYLRLRQLRRRGPDVLALALYEDRFNYWRKLTAPRRSAHAVLFVLCLLFGLQCWAGISDSIHLLGVRRDEVLNGQPWRLLTAGLVHAHWLHILLNGTAIWVYWQSVGALIGVPRLLSCLVLSVLGGSLASVAWHAHTWSVGASSGIAGLIGYELVLFLGHRAVMPTSMLRAAAWVIVANALMGLAGHGFIDNAGHAGGFVTGALYAFLSRTSIQSLPLPPSRAATLFGVASGAVWLAAVGVSAAHLVLR